MPYDIIENWHNWQVGSPEVGIPEQVIDRKGGNPGQSSDEVSDAPCLMASLGAASRLRHEAGGEVSPPTIKAGGGLPLAARHPCQGTASKNRREPGLVLRGTGAFNE